MTRFILPFAALLVLSACTDADRSTTPLGDAGVIEADAAPHEDAGPRPEDAGPRPEDAGSADAGVPDAVGFSMVFASVFYPRCAHCHDGAPRSPSPVISAHDALVGAESTEVPGVLLVAAGDPEASYLYRKIAGTHADVCIELELPATDCGLRMPRGVDAAPLSEDELELVREWIEGGALP